MIGVMASFSNRFLHCDVINSVIITEIRLLFEISKINMLFSKNFSNAPTPQPIFVTKDKSSFIKSFWIEEWGNININDDTNAKMPIYSYIRKLNKCVCMIQINY